MTRFVERTLRWSTGRRVLVALLVLVLGGSILFQMGPYPEVTSAAGNVSLPEETITDPEALQMFLTELEEGGRKSYLQFQFWDFANPLLIGFFGVLLIGWLTKRSGLVRGRTITILIPFITPVSDFCENLVIIGTIVVFPERALFTQLLPVFTSAKFFGLAVTLLLVIVLAVLAIRVRMRGTPSAL